MGYDDYGESSEQNEDGDVNTPQRKKAKYVWQVKGKYHLKPNSDVVLKTKQIELETEEKVETQQYSCSEQSPHEGRQCIDKFLARTESFLDSDDDDDTISRNIDKSISNEIPITLVGSNPKNQDYYLRKWQARQIARGYIDNTINRVLENWSPAAAFDAEDFVENCDHDGRVEDQGILMAIEAHGLQSNSKKKEIIDPEELADTTLNKIDTARCQFFKQSNNRFEESTFEADLGLSVEYPVSVINAAILVAISQKGLSSN